MRGFSNSSRRQSSSPVQKKHGRSRVEKNAVLRQASASTVENLEGRLLLSTTTSDGFVATFYGAQFTSATAFPNPPSTAPLASATYSYGDYSTHMDVINSADLAQGNAPTDASANFNTNSMGVQNSGGPGDLFSADFSTNLNIVQSGYFTFYPATDDGAEIDINHSAVGAQNLGAGRGTTQDTDADPNELTAGSTYAFDFLYNNGGGGWQYELRWSATSGPNGTGTQLIPMSLMTGAGAPGVANLNAPTPLVATTAPTEVGSGTTNSITISWPTHDVDAASYIIERSSDFGSTFQAVNTGANGQPLPVASTDGSTDTYTDVGLSPKSVYEYKIVSNSITGQASPGYMSEPTSPASSLLVTQASNPPLGVSAVGVAASSAGNVLTILSVQYATQYNILESSTLNGTYATIGTVAAGPNSTVSYTDTGDNANVYYKVQAVDTAVATTDPGYSSTTGPATLSHGDGFGASYYTGSFNGGATFSSTTPFSPTSQAAVPSFSTIIPTIDSGAQNNTVLPPYTPANFNIGQGVGNQGNAFSTEFDFTVVAPYSETFTFIPRTDDGVQLTVDGTVIDAQGSRGATNDTAVVPTAWTAGSVHTIQMAYYNGGGGWEADLAWTSPSIAALNPSGFNGLNATLVPSYDASALGVAPAANPIAPVIADPPALTIAASNGPSVYLNFTASEADSYDIYRGTSPGGEGSTPYATIAGNPNATTGVATYTYNDTAATAGSTYYYTVVGVNTSGLGVPSNEVSYMPAASPPPAPTGVTATPGALMPTPLTLGGSGPTVAPITVTFNSSLFATSYDILRATVTGGVAGTFSTIATGITATSYVDQTAAFNSEYQYEVVARDSVDPTGSGPAPAATSAPTPTAHTDQGALEEFYANSQNWGGAVDNSSSSVSGVVGKPTSSSQQTIIDYVAYPDSQLPPGGTYLPADTYSTLWTGKVHITTTGQYTFYKNSDDDGILYVDGALVASGPYSANNITGVYNATNGTYGPAVVLTLNGSTDPTMDNYDFQMFQEQGGGGHGTEMLYSGPDTSNAIVTVPSTALIPATGAPLAATNLVATVGGEGSGGIGTAVSVSFTDNADNELEYMLQRSTSPTFASGITTVASSGADINGAPQSGGAITTDTATLVDNDAPSGQTVYYRVVAENFNGSTTSVPSTAVTIPGSASAGVEVNYYNNEWWDSTNQSTTAVVTGGVNSAVSTTALTSVEETILPNIDYLGGTDGGSGDITTNSSNAKYPDPGEIIPPDDFSTVFTGQVNITNAGTYTFATNSDDDSYLYVDDQLVSAYPGGHGPGNGETNTPINLTSGEHNIEYFQSNGGGGWAWNMLYDGPDNTADPGVLTTVPASVLTNTMSPLTAPTNVSVGNASVSGTTGNSLTVSFTENNTSAVRYVLQRSTDSGFDAAGNVTSFVGGLDGNGATGTDTAVDTGLAFGTTYYYRVEAQNYDGTGTFSTVASGTTGTVQPTVPVTADENVNGNVVVGFPLPTTGSVSGYQVQVSANGGAYTTLTTLPAGTNSYTDTASYAAGTSLTYQVTVQSSSSSVSNSAPSTSNTVLYITGTKNVNHPTGFTGQSDLTLTEGASFAPVITSSGQLQLTSSATGSTATSAFTTNPISISSDFTTSFDFQFNAPNADGFGFVIQNQGNNVVGAGGGGIGYTGQFSNSLGVGFNQYSGVTQVSLLENGSIVGWTNMTSLGNAFHNVNSAGNTDVFQATITLDDSTDSTTGAVIHLVVRDTTTELGYTQDFVLPANAVGASSLFGPNSKDYVGFTGGDGGATSTQYVNDLDFVTINTTPTVTGISPSSEPWDSSFSDNYQPITITGTNFTGATSVQFGTITTMNFTVNSPTSITVTPTDQLNAGTVDVTVTTPAGGTSATSSADQFTYTNGVVAPSVTSVVVNGGNTALAGAQRSMVTSIVYTFSEAVNASTGAFTIALHTGGTHTAGTLPTLSWAPVSGTANADGSSTQWAVTFSGAGVQNGSIADGVYDITMNPSGVTLDGNPSVQATARATDTFYRLYGDDLGTESVTGQDYNAFLATFGLNKSASGYNPAFNIDGNKTIGGTDYNVFLTNFGTRFKGFTPTI